MLSAKLNLLFLRYLMTLRLLILDLKPDKAKLSTESFSENSVLDINLALYQLSFFVLIRNTVLSMQLPGRLRRSPVLLIPLKSLVLNVFQWWFWRTWSFINTRWFLNTCLKESYLFSRSRSLRDEKLLNDGPFDTRKCSFFLVLIWLQVSNLTPDLWIVVADKTALVFGILMLFELCLNKSTVWPSMEYRHLFWLSFLSA